MHIGVVAVLDGGALVDADGRFRIEAARRAVGRRLCRVPRFRQVLHVPPRLLGPPVWVDAAAVDLARHVHVRPLAPPAGTAQLVQVVEELWSPRLDLARPPWEMWFLPGLTGGRVGVLLKVHHVVADGVGGMALLGALLDRDVTGEPRPSDRPPALPPSTSALLRDQLRRLRPSGEGGRRARPPGRSGARDASGVGGDARARRRPADAADEPGSRRRDGAPAARRQRPPRPGARRRARTRCDGERRAAGGRRRRPAGAPAEPGGGRPRSPPARLRARHAPAPPRRGGPPRRRRHDVRAPAAGGRRPRRAAPPGGGGRRRLQAARHPRPGGRAEPQPARPPAHDAFRGAAALGRRVRGQRPRSAAPLYLAGAQVQELYPVVPLAGRVPVGVGALSYAGRLGITVVADRDACPDIEIFTDGLRAALAELAAGAARPAVSSSRTAAPGPRSSGNAGR